MRALIMSSNQITCAGLRAVLESHPTISIVREISAPSMALEAAAHEKPDIILIDLELYSIHVLRLLKELEKASRRSLILILSDLADGELTQKALRHGAAGVVFKVQPPAVLIATIESLCREGARESESERPRLEKGPIPNILPLPESAGAAEKINSLTSREREIIRLIGIGLRNKEIARRLSISDITVRHHLTNIFSKLEVSDRQKLLVLAHQYNLIDQALHPQVS
jgi:DNA-binding NarL/FixJ family response regulator